MMILQSTQEHCRWCIKQKSSGHKPIRALSWMVIIRKYRHDLMALGLCPNHILQVSEVQLVLAHMNTIYIFFFFIVAAILRVVEVSCEDKAFYVFLALSALFLLLC